MTTTTRTWNDVTDDELRAYQRSTQYVGLATELLDDAAEGVVKAQAALNKAETRRRINALICVRAGMSKTIVANKLAVSRPTLDAWLAAANADPDEVAEVVQHERRERHEIAQGRVRHD